MAPMMCVRSYGEIDWLPPVGDVPRYLPAMLIANRIERNGRSSQRGGTVMSPSRDYDCG